MGLCSCHPLPAAPPESSASVHQPYGVLKWAHFSHTPARMLAAAEQRVRPTPMKHIQSGQWSLAWDGTEGICSQTRTFPSHNVASASSVLGDRQEVCYTWTRSGSSRTAPGVSTCHTRGQWVLVSGKSKQRF
eukprot:6230174-Amphidinium_carterae.1